MVVTMENTKFLDVTAFIFLEARQRFGVTCRRGIRSRNQQEAVDNDISLLALSTSGFLSGLFLDPEYGSSKFLRNFGGLNDVKSCPCAK
jgi:hypothetical protein